MASGGFSQEALRALWLSGASGKLSAMGQVKAWALREAWRATHSTTYGMLVFVAKHAVCPCRSCLPAAESEAAGQKGVAHTGGNPIFKSQEAFAPVCNRQVWVFS